MHYICLLLCLTQRLECFTYLVEQKSGAVGNVDIGAAAVDGGEVLDEKRPHQLDLHAPLESDPHLSREHGRAVAERARAGTHRVVAGVSNRVPSQAATDVVVHGCRKADGASGEALPVGRPVAVAPPAPVNCVHALRRASIANEDQNEEGEKEALLGGEGSRSHCRPCD